MSYFCLKLCTNFAFCFYYITCSIRWRYDGIPSRIYIYTTFRSDSNHWFCILGIHINAHFIGLVFVNVQRTVSGKCYASAPAVSIRNKFSDMIFTFYVDFEIITHHIHCNSVFCIIVIFDCKGVWSSVVRYSFHCWNIFWVDRIDSLVFSLRIARISIVFDWNISKCPITRITRTIFSLCRN